MLNDDDMVTMNTDESLVLAQLLLARMEARASMRASSERDEEMRTISNLIQKLLPQVSARAALECSQWN